VVFVVTATHQAGPRTAAAPDRKLIAVVGICLVLSASLAPHFGFVPAGPRAFIKAHSSRVKQQCLANDALQWTVPEARFAPAPPLPSLSDVAAGEHWGYSPDNVTAQLYNRPPPSA
jgi:hypothetical protein